MGASAPILFFDAHDSQAQHGPRDLEKLGVMLTEAEAGRLDELRRAKPDMPTRSTLCRMLIVEGAARVNINPKRPQLWGKTRTQSWPGGPHAGTSAPDRRRDIIVSARPRTAAHSNCIAMLKAKRACVSASP